MNESVYGRLASHFCVNFPEVPASMGFCRGAPLFGTWRAAWDAPLAALLATTAADAALLRGQDLQGGAVTRVELAPHLRYCVQCLRAGYHATVFQHFALSHCPIHKQALRHTCHHCDRRIVPSIATIRDFPGICPHCEKALFTLRSQRDAEFDARKADASLSQIRHALGQGAARAGRSWNTGVGLLAIDPAATARHYQRVLGLGAQGLDGPLVSFAEQQLTAPACGAGSDAITGFPTVREFVPALKWLSANCPAADDVCRLCATSGLLPGGRASDRDVSAAAVALYKVLLHYDLSDAFVLVHRGIALVNRHLDVPLSKRYSPPVTFSVVLNQRVTALELFSLLAVLLASEPHGLLAAVDWYEVADPVSFAPVWTQSSDKDGAPSIRVRARADEAALLRLFKRLGRRRFEGGTGLPSSG